MARGDDLLNACMHFTFVGVNSMQSEFVSQTAKICGIESDYQTNQLLIIFPLCVYL